MVPRASTASLELTIDDGHGRATAIFFGRKKLPGIAPGRSIVIEGMTMAEHGQVVLYNPAYELL